MIPIPGGATTLVIVGIIAAGAIASWRIINGQHEEIGRLNERLTQAEAKVLNAHTLLDTKNRQIQNLMRRIGKAEAERTKLDQQLSERKAQITRLEATDEKFSAWANTRLPDGACSLLQQPIGTGTARHNLPDCGQPGAPSLAPTEDAHHNQPAPAGTD